MLLLGSSVHHANGSEPKLNGHPDCSPDELTAISAACPLSGKGKITQVIDSKTIWIRPSGDNANLNVERANNNTFKNKSRNRKKGIKINVLGINNTAAKLDSLDKRNIETDAIDFLYENLLGKEVDFNCYYIDEKISLICGIEYQKNDIGLIYIQRGLSEYNTRYGKHPTKDREYRAAEGIAKSKKLGIWKPFFGMFIFNNGRRVD
ncbi:hypothetical protein D3C81_134200 [compost metagenome]